MPTAARLTAAVGVTDVELADWAARNQIKASAGQIRRWRRAGLLPSPTVPRPRPRGAPAGRAAKGYNDSDLQTAHRAVAFLAARGRRGRPSTDLALLLFAAGLPVRQEVVVAALRVRMEGIRRAVQSFMGVAQAQHGTISDEMAVSPVFDRAEAGAQYTLSTGHALVDLIRRNLRKSGQPASEPDVLSTLIGLFRTVLGDPPPSDDTYMLNQLLHAFDAHGLVEQPFPGAPVVMPEGPSGLSEALTLATAAAVLTVPDDITTDELNSALRFCSTLGPALAAIPDAGIRHHLGGEGAVGFWQPEDPANIAQMLTFQVNMARRAHLDPSPLIAAIQERGWLPGINDPRPEEALTRMNDLRPMSSRR